MIDKVVFLDVDGVLNWRGWKDRAPAPPHLFTSRWMKHHFRSLDPSKVLMLNFLVDDGAVFVLSSTWRYSFSNNVQPMQRLLEARGFYGKLIGRTPLPSEQTGEFDHMPDEISDCPRGRQIAEWLSTTPARSFVILDDSRDMAHLGHRLVRVDNLVGLTIPNINDALTLLRNP